MKSSVSLYYGYSEKTIKKTDHPPIDISDQTDIRHLKMIMIDAMYRDHTATLEAFLVHPLFLNVLRYQDFNGDTLLHYVFSHTNQTFAMRILEAKQFDLKCDPNLSKVFQIKNYVGITPLQCAENNPQRGIIEKIKGLYIPEAQNLRHSLIEDFIHSDKSTIMMNRTTYFREDIDRVADELGINIYYSDKDDEYLWTRDYFYTTFDERGDIVTHIALPSSVSYMEQRASGSIEEKATLLLRNKGIAGVFKKSGNPPHLEEPTPLSEIRWVAKSPYQDYIFSSFLPKQVNAKAKTVALEGGNLIKATNSQGDLKFIVGESAIVHSAMYHGRDSDFGAASPSYQQYLKEIVPGSKGVQKSMDSYAAEPDVVDAKQLAEQRIAEKYRIAHELTQSGMGVFHKESKRDVIAVPQWTFHIDLQMSYLGNGKVLVHSFERTLAFLDQNKAQVLAELDQLIQAKAINWTDSAEALFQKIVYVNKELAQTYETSVVDETIRKLEKHGFSVTPCCGNLFTDFPEKGYLGEDLLGCFMNGLGGHSSKTERDYFLTARSPLASFEHYFAQQVLAPLGVDGRFLNMVPGQGDIPDEKMFTPWPGDEITTPDMVSAINTVKTIDSLHGSFRCQTSITDPAVGSRGL